MKGIYSIGLLLLSNIFMTIAWYGHLRYQNSSKIAGISIVGIILISWGIAFFEYCVQVPANRLGYKEHGGPFTLLELKVIQEVLSLVVFLVFTFIFFKNESLKWNHFVGLGCIVLAVYFVFKK